MLKRDKEMLKNSFGLENKSFINDLEVLEDIDLDSIIGGLKCDYDYNSGLCYCWDYNEWNVPYTYWYGDCRLLY